GKAVQQQDGWRVLRPGFAIEDLDAVDIHFPKRNRAHRKSFRSVVNGADGGYRRGFEKIRPRKGYPLRSPPVLFLLRRMVDVAKLPQYVTHSGSPVRRSTQLLPSGSEKSAKLA